MVEEEKVKLMTKLALYEKNHSSDEIKMEKYYKGDYVGFKLIGTAFAATIGFVCVYLILLILNSETFIESLTQLDLVNFIINILVAYVFFLAAFLVLTYLLYSYRFRKGRQSLKQYNADLKQLIKLLKREKKEKIGRQIAERRERRAAEDDDSEEEEDDYDIISY